MENSGFGSRTKTLVGFYILCIFLCQNLHFLVADEMNKNQNPSENLCLATQLTDFLPPPYSNISDTMPCVPLWNTFVLRYSENKENNVMTFILSALYTTGWVGMGFSKTGQMIGSSAMIGWISRKGHAKINQYYLQGIERDQIVPDSGELQLQRVPPVVVLHGAMIYLAFQVKFVAKIDRRPIILAFSTTYPTKLGRLSKHDDKTTVFVDFSKGNGVTSMESTSSKDKKKHGIIGIFGWGFLLPLGAMLARYLRHKDPLWYYLHIGVQFVGFIFGLTALVLGIQLYNRIQPDIPAHRAIGIFLLVLTILQVLAFFARPQKETKMRRYWNWYHHWIGRISLFFGSINIVLGIKLANEGDNIKIGYGFLLGFTLLSFLVLEILRIRGSIGSPSSHAPSHHAPTSFETHPTSVIV